MKLRFDRWLKPSFYTCVANDLDGFLALWNSRSPALESHKADHNRSFEAIGGWAPRTATVTGQGKPEEVRTIIVTKGVLEALRVKPVVGRWLSEADQSPGADRVVMLSFGYWQRRFGGDQAVIGKSGREAFSQQFVIWSYLVGRMVNHTCFTMNSLNKR